MTTIATADDLLTVRGSNWASQSDEIKTAALAKASDYITANYTLVAEPDDDQRALLDLATALLADEFRSSQPALAAPTTIKESKEQLGTLLTDITYFDAPTDPYPTITGLLKSLVVDANPSVRFGRMVR